MIPLRTAAMIGLPMRVIAHFRIRVFFGIYGFRSSVPRIVHAFV
jgi:hypothetical protein